MNHEPPHRITPRILGLVEEIGEAIGRAESAVLWQDLRLRRRNRIRTLRGSLAIEGNTLSEEQITTILDGKPVVGPLRDVQEARNAIKAYDEFERWEPSDESHLLRAHELLMTALLDEPGCYRRGRVAVVGGGEVQHVGPPAARVPQLMKDLLHWLATTDAHPLVASSVFHYEFEFIHPFDDGNGRLGRLWQTLILTRWNPIFAHIPVESLVHARQSDYYRAIRASSAEGASSKFIEFMLEVILAALATPQVTPQATPQESPQVLRLLRVLTEDLSTRQMLFALGLSERRSFRARYLAPAIAAGYVEPTRPDAPTAPNQMYRLTRQGRAVLDAT